MDVAAAPPGSPERPADPTGAAPRVLAVVVTRDGTRWLEATLDALEAQTYQPIDIIGVDNGSRDASREQLIERLGHDAVLLAERDIGFGAAVAMALDTARARRATYVLTVHDDTALDREAVQRLVQHLEDFPDVAVAGTKNLDWEDPGRLQSMGFSVDFTGRAHSELEPDERDHGQRDHIRRVLYTSTSGMLIRREVFERLGGFDRRYHLFRDDLDLCWRAWMAGWEVEVVPAARGRHVASAANYDRLGQAAFLGPRYFAERNTLATLLKNYGTLRLAAVVPLFFLVGILKVAGFLATRRVGDAWQTVRAWAWNLLHLRETWRLRRKVQQLRRVEDPQLRPLFARLIPRARAYLEAIVDWVTGGEHHVEEQPPIQGGEPETITQQVLQLVRRHPTATTAGALAVIGLLVAAPVLAPGSLRGGELASWPSSPLAFLGDYLLPWHDAGAVGTALAPSPAQAILGLVDLFALSSQWLASRLLLLGALPLAWLLALRATAPLTRDRLPRLVGATAYVLSPPVVAALQSGRISVLVVTVAIPALAIAFTSVLRPGGSVANAWRATAAAALIAATAVAFAPAALVPLLAWILVGLIGLRGLALGARAVRLATLRLLAVAVGTLGLLVPWSLRLFLPSGPLLGGGAEAAAQPGGAFWRWLLLSPRAVEFPGVVAGAGLLVAGVLAIAVAFHARPVEVAALWAAALGGIFAGWGLAGAGNPALAWAGLPLVFSAAALAALLVIALTSATVALREYELGWRHVAGGAIAAAVAVGLAASGWSFVGGQPWAGYAVEEPALPAFLASEDQDTGPVRVLVLSTAQDDSGELHWDVTRPTGPTMAAYGVPLPETFVSRVDATVEAFGAGSDPGAADTLALLNIGYVVVPAGRSSAALDDALAAQLALEPQPVAAGRVYRVDGALPRAAWLPRPAVRAIGARGEVPEGARVRPLKRAPGGAWRGEVPGPGAVVLSNVEPVWEARTADGQVLTGTELGPVQRFPVGEGGTTVQLTPTGQVGRAAAVGLQFALVLLVFSLALRPPRFARGPEEDREAPLVGERVPAGAERG